MCSGVVKKTHRNPLTAPPAAVVAGASVATAARSDGVETLVLLPMLPGVLTEEDGVSWNAAGRALL